MSVLVTGGTGFIGRHIVDELLAQRESVHLLVRSLSHIPLQWHDKARITIGDLSSVEKLCNACIGVDRVLHIAGEWRIIANMHSTNVLGTQNLLDACQTAGVKHVLYLSSVSVIGAPTKTLVDETHICRPETLYQQTKYKAESFAKEWSVHSKIPLAIVRAPSVFGDGLHQTFDSMLELLRAIQQGRFLFFDYQAAANYLYVKDLVSACLHASGTSAEGVYIVSDSSRLVDFINACSEALGVSKPRLFLPLPFAYLTASIMQHIIRNSPLTTSRVQALSNRTVYRSARMNALGWSPPIGYREGLRRTVEWYKSTGQL